MCLLSNLEFILSSPLDAVDYVCFFDYSKTKTTSSWVMHCSIWFPIFDSKLSDTPSRATVIMLKDKSHHSYIIITAWILPYHILCNSLPMHSIHQKSPKARTWKLLRTRQIWLALTKGFYISLLPLPSLKKWSIQTRWHFYKYGFSVCEENITQVLLDNPLAFSLSVFKFSPVENTDKSKTQIVFQDNNLWSNNAKFAQELPPMTNRDNAGISPEHVYIHKTIRTDFLC